MEGRFVLQSTDVTSLRVEASQKWDRLQLSTMRWLLTSAGALLLREAAYEQREHISFYLPSWSATAMFLAVWAIKGVWDVVEDVLPPRSPFRVLGVLAVLGGCFGALVCVLNPVLWVMMTATVLGSAVAGGLDTPMWRVLAGMCAVGMVAGASDHLSVLAAVDVWALVLGVAAHALVDGVQDRLQDFHTAWVSSVPGLAFVLCVKVLPLITVCTVVFCVQSAFALAMLLFLLCSPHMLVYDVAKVWFCTLVLFFSPTTDRKAIMGAGAVGTDYAREVLINCLLGVATCCRRRVVWLSKGGTTHTQEVKDLALAHKVLQSSVKKGSGGIEWYVLPLWHPIIPTESVDGVQWRRMRSAVSRVLKSLDRPGLSAPVRVDQLLSQLFQQVPLATPLDSDTVGRVFCAALHEVLFGEPPSSTDIDLWLAACTNIKARISMRANLDTVDGNARVRAFRRCEELVQQSRRLTTAVAELVDERERVSVVLQPFLLGPLINLSDSMVASVEALHNTCWSAQAQARVRAYNTTESSSSIGDRAVYSNAAPSWLGSARAAEACSTHKGARALAWYALRVYPPFPLLERVLPATWGGDGGIAPGTHVFIPSDQMGPVCSDHLSFTASPTTAQASSAPSDLMTGGKAANGISGAAPPPAAAAATTSLATTLWPWLAFGAGPRACPGQALGLALLAGGIQHGIAPRAAAVAKTTAAHTHAQARDEVQAQDLSLFKQCVCPSQGHRFSGRLHQDQKDPQDQPLFIVLVVVRSIVAGIAMGLRGLCSAASEAQE